MKHIVHVINGLPQGGAESLLVTYLRRMATRGARHTVCTVYAPSVVEDFWSPHLHRLGVATTCLGALRRADLPRAALDLARWARRHRVSLFHAHLTDASLVARLAGMLARVPVVTTLHNVSYEPEILATFRNPGSPKHELARLLEGASSILCDAKVIAVGETVAESAHRRLHVPRSRMQVIRNPVDLTRFECPPEHTRNQLLSSLGIPEDARLLLNVGRIVPQKATDDAVRVLALVARRHPNAHLVVAGAPQDLAFRDRVRDLAETLGVADRVHLPGSVHSVPDWLRHCDVFLFPSRYEGLPLALAEAGVAGCACVASDIAANREVIDHERTGLLAPVGDCSALANAVLRLLEDPDLAERLRQSLRSEAARRFSPDAAVTALSAVYDDCAR